jgi:tRNA (guanine-N7-)-methyltransferase
MTSRRARPYDDVPALPAIGDLEIGELVSAGDGPIEMEIGFGKGHFMIERAQACPSARLVGIETRRKWVALVAERAEKRALSNVRVYYGDARAMLPRIRSQGCLARVYVNFPDPWWKARHEKRLVVVPAVIDRVAHLLMPGGEIFVQTDVDHRGEYYQQVLGGSAPLVPACGDGRIDGNPYGARSLREKNCERIGLPIYRYLYVRRR